MADSGAFGTRLATAFARWGQLCIGIDPHAWLLGEWGLNDDAAGLREFGLRVVDAAHGRVGIVKPQVAFFERHGSAGYAALESVLSAARDAGLIVIADGKRGDVGTTAEAYGQAWLTPGSPLEADAMTANAFQGIGSLSGPIALATHAGKGLFVLAATSNPESLPLQTAVIAPGVEEGTPGRTVAAGIVDGVIGLNASESMGTVGRVGSFGVVIGATVDPARFGLPLQAMATHPATPVLAPGFGHQGASFTDLRARYGPCSPFVVATTSREVLAAGPSGIERAIERGAGELAECLA
ncbi:orotidine-5'-phosphate decarboxylase [Cryobacterium mesophilum]|uniref:Orotidine-5'-phosphate decarboxylase n=1 Tax=Terrimesophilobacter mesophilus TaxID=433647 RepID=A0A4R8V808_9MICO|nr:orotidine-5'-phosphate decarboxylase [Terrimesophilobacter mesophilus]MBB5631883.1 orotidine-5'-phosphate decarboxylase [Terrimesophilobacter mesophilus]TFB78793.1 orotidine-5'-phosphate decarboxylase [Terrimesophilobacter mesophilus]